MLESAIASEVLPEDEIKSRVAELGAAIASDYEGRDPLFLVMLNGSVPFGADLVRAVPIPSEVDFLGLNRYGKSGKIGVTLDTSTPLFDRNVIIVEDITDTGLTLATLRRMILDRGAASVATASLLDKTRRRLTEVPIEYRGFEVGDEFLVGYGLDWQGLYRNLRSIWAVLDMEAFVVNPSALLPELGMV
ncbi:MAG TPA: hypoxanthine phosphoribosyltransferase [Acidimicrobiia bacterium]|jgi:hypoxanthine phosphoribosyltransferase|nr:hypoxanthine phosphoribosyltransferase [Acidimicrobiia bacterium]